MNLKPNADAVPSALRGRFRFGLRTLFIAITLLGCWLGYALHWIHQRHELLDLLESQMTRRMWAIGIHYQSRRDYSDNAPWYLRMLGEKGQTYIDPRGSDMAISASQAEIDRVQRLFPEAKVESPEMLRIPKPSATPPP